MDFSVIVKSDALLKQVPVNVKFLAIYHFKIAAIIDSLTLANFFWLNIYLEYNFTRWGLVLLPILWLFHEKKLKNITLNWQHNLNSASILSLENLPGNKSAWLLLIINLRRSAIPFNVKCKTFTVSLVNSFRDWPRGLKSICHFTLGPFAVKSQRPSSFESVLLFASFRHCNLNVKKN